MPTTEELLFILRMQDGMTAVLAASRTETEALGRSAEATTSRLTAMKTAALEVSAAVGSIFVASEGMNQTLGIFSTWEQQMLSIVKVTGMSKEQMASFGEEFDAMARRTPLAIQGLAETAAAAGALGIHATPDLIKFTETVAKIATITNVTGQQAAQAMARIQRVFHEPIADVERLGSVFAHVDDVTAATSRELIRLSTEVSLATAAFHIGSTEAIAIAGALGDMGVLAERGGTAVGRTFMAIDAAVRGNTKHGLEDLTRLLGMSSQQLAALWGQDKVKVFDLFIQKLGETIKQGKNYGALLADLNLGQAQTAKSLVPLATNWEGLAAKERIAFQELQSDDWLKSRFGLFADAMAQKLILLDNDWTLFRKDIGQAIAPQAKTGIDVLAASINQLDLWFKEMPPNARRAGADVVAYGGSALAAVAGVMALYRAVSLLGPLLLGGWWGVAIAGAVTLAGVVADMSGVFGKAVEPTDAQAEELNKLGGNAEQAAIAIGKLTEAQRVQMSAMNTALLEQSQAELAKLERAMQVAGVDMARAMSDAMFSTMSATDDRLEQAYMAWKNGPHKGIDEYQQKLAELSKDPSLHDQALKILALTEQWKEAAAKAAQYGTVSDRLAHPETAPAGKPEELPTPPTPPTEGNVPDWQSRQGEQRAKQTAEFIRDTEEKIAAMQREATALRLSEAAYKSQQRAEEEAAAVDTLSKRGRELEMSTQRLTALTTAYAAAQHQLNEEKRQQDVANEVKQIDLKMASMEKEAAALLRGKQAYEDYKKASKLDDDTEAFARKLRNLGMEESAVQALVARYRELSGALVAANDQYAANQRTEQDVRSLTQGISKDFAEYFEKITEGGKQAQHAWADLKEQLRKMLLDEALFKPLQQLMEGTMNALLGLGGGGSGGGGAGAGGGGGGIAGAILNSVFGGKATGGAGGLPGGGLLGALAGKAYSALFSGSTDAAPGVAGGVQTATGNTVPEAAFDDVATAQAGVSTGMLSGVGSFFSGIGNWLSSLFSSAPAAAAHTGALIGVDPGTLRMLDRALLASAPRFHDGLDADEFAAVLQRGERVLTANDNARMENTMQRLVAAHEGASSSGVRARENAPSVTHVWNISTPNADSFRASQGSLMAKANAAASRHTQRGG